ncbi:N-acetylglucosamine-6-phosphate deacetylase [Phycicoccus sonneratiae]|uniref:N-acetylglucosamine-6-phosphate deacetylase n=1 Tax=Phycicoccus sonneratiae TaxID=2807628 RepID=A0ABS2CMY2_9MICO|nr:N-acetylglucosamine-6-phosphate deacetylase [Phycicoccus sonneraticus]MBM6401183.1 N-acetylglucosamine-6-phosphate deacetylase [Phycicoccus sonneraticus]
MTGLVDIHCHGAAGAELGDTADGSRAAVAHHAAAGTHRLVASLVSAPADDLVSRVATLAPLVADGTLAGIHLEGPFLSHGRRGAHDPAALALPDPALVERLAEAAALAGAPDALRHMTFAPELPGADPLVRTLVELGIRPSVGHTEADAATTARTLAEVAELQGAPALVTHLFNGMPPLHHRAGGPVAAALAAAARGEALLELITDGVHVAPEVVRMVFDTVGPQSVVLVSDAMAATGLGDGRYRLGGLEVEVTAGTARTTDTGSIAGSTSTLADCVRWCIEVAGIPEADVLTAATTTPLRALGLTG